MNVQRPQYPPVGMGPAGSPAPPGMQRPPGPGPQPYSGPMVRPPSHPQTPGSKRPTSSSSSKRCVTALWSLIHVCLTLSQTISNRKAYHAPWFMIIMAHFKIKTKLRCLLATGKAWPFFLCIGVTVAALVVAAGPPPKLRPVAKCHPPQITPIAAPKRKRSLQKRYFHRRYEKLYKCTLYLTLDG